MRVAACGAGAEGRRAAVGAAAAAQQCQACSVFTSASCGAGGQPGNRRAAAAVRTLLHRHLSANAQQGDRRQGRPQQPLHRMHARQHCWNSAWAPRNPAAGPFAGAGGRGRWRRQPPTDRQRLGGWRPQPLATTLLHNRKCSATAQRTCGCGIEEVGRAIFRKPRLAGPPAGCCQPRPPDLKLRRCGRDAADPPRLCCGCSPRGHARRATAAAWLLCAAEMSDGLSPSVASDAAGPRMSPSTLATTRRPVSASAGARRSCRLGQLPGGRPWCAHPLESGCSEHGVLPRCSLVLHTGRRLPGALAKRHMCWSQPPQPPALCGF